MNGSVKTFQTLSYCISCIVTGTIREIRKVNHMNYLLRSLKLPFCFLLLFILCSGSAMASPFDRDASNFLSNIGIYVFLAAGPVREWTGGGSGAHTKAFRDLDAELASGLVAEGLKQFIREERPDGSGNDSFPSGHATVSFALAATESAFHPSEAPYWYGGAALISASRVRLGKHYWKDVLAGTVIGLGMAQLSISQPHGLILTPFIKSGGGGVEVHSIF